MLAKLTPIYAKKIRRHPGPAKKEIVTASKTKSAPTIFVRRSLFWGASLFLFRLVSGPPPKEMNQNEWKSRRVDNRGGGKTPTPSVRTERSALGGRGSPTPKSIQIACNHGEWITDREGGGNPSTSVRTERSAFPPPPAQRNQSEIN